MYISVHPCTPMYTHELPWNSVKFHEKPCTSMQSTATLSVLWPTWCAPVTSLCMALHGLACVCMLCHRSHFTAVHQTSWILSHHCHASTFAQQYPLSISTITHPAPSMYLNYLMKRPVLPPTPNTSHLTHCNSDPGTRSGVSVRGISNNKISRTTKSRWPFTYSKHL